MFTDMMAALQDMAAGTSWMSRGRCAETDPEAFFPERDQSCAEAQAVCRRCPVRARCLDYALDTGQPYGVWGGLTELERRRLKRRQPAAA